MADNFNMGPKLTIDGEAEFKKAITGINKDMAVLGSEMKLVGAKFDDNKNSIEALTAKSEVYNKQIDEQKSKIKLMVDALESAKKEYGENSDKVKEWQIKLNGAETGLIKLTKEADDNKAAMSKGGTETAQTTTHVEKFAKEADSAADKTNKWGDQLKAVGSHLGAGFGVALKGAAIGIAAMATAAVAAGAALGKMITSSLENADAVQQAADIYGMTAERVQELTYAGTKLDVSLDTITGAQTKLTKSMTAAEKGTGAQAEAFKALGISVNDSNGNLRDSKTVMTEAFNALNKVGNETERDSLSMQLFGKSAMELNPLIKAGGDELNRLSEEAYETGAVMSNAAIEGLDKFGDSAEAFKLSINGVAGTLATALLPAMDGVLSFAQGLLPEIEGAFTSGNFASLGAMLGDGISKAVEAISVGLDKFMPVVTNLLTSLATTIVTVLPTIIPVLLDAAMQLVQGILDAITENIAPLSKMVVDLVTSIAKFILDNLPVVIAAGITILTALITGLVSALPQLIDGAILLITSLLTAILGFLPVVLQAGMDILLALIDGLAKAIPTMIPVIMDCIEQLLSTFVTNLPLIITAGMDLLLALVEGIVDAIPTLIKMLPTIIDDMVDYFMEALPQIIDSGLKILVALIKGVVDAIPQLVAMLPTIITTIVNVLTNNLPLIIDAAIKILVTLIKGLTGALPKLIAMLPTIITTIVNVLTNNLPLIIDAAVLILMAVITGLIQTIPELVKAIPQIVTAIFNAFGKIDWSTIGKNIIEGVKTGITNAAAGLAAAATAAANSAVKGVKDFLGISSPSKVFAEIGGNMSEGMAIGIKGRAGLVSDAMTKINKDLTANANILVSRSVGNFATSTSDRGNGGITIINQGTIVGSNGMNEFADIVSKKIARTTGLAMGGAW